MTNMCDGYRYREGNVVTCVQDLEKFQWLVPGVFDVMPVRRGDIRDVTCLNTGMKPARQRM